nr:phage tail tape measure protein [Haloechinothrix aidingensis]
MDELSINVGADASDAESELGGLAGVIDRNFATIAAAGAAAGGAMEAFARSQQDVNASMDVTAVRSELSADAVRGLATELSEGQGDASDFAFAMEDLAQAGVTSEEGMRDVLPAIDDLATAMGTDLPSAIGDVESVLTPLGMSMEDAAGQGDALFQLMDQADGSVGRLTRVLNRVPDELDALNFGLEDTSAAIQVFEDRGFEANRAIKEVEQALSDSEGDMESFLESIGLTADEWARYQDESQAVPGSLEEISDAADTNDTLLQSLQNRVDDLMFRYGGLAEAAGTVAPALLALGPIGKTIVGITKAWTLAQTKLNLTMLANPIFLIIAAIAALIAIGVLVIKNWDEVKAAFQAAWDWIWDKASAFADWFTRTFWRRGIKRALDAFVGGLGWVRDQANSVIGWVTGRMDWMRDKFWGAISDIKGFFGGMWGGVTSGARSAVNGAIGLINGAIGGINSLIDGANSVPGVSIPHIPSIPMLAEGGDILGGGRAVVGERGPEVLDLPRGARVSPLERGAGGLGGTLRIELDGDEDLIRLFRRGIKARGGLDVVFAGAN